MKKLLTLFAILLLSSCGKLALRNAEFMPSLPDVPLPEGFQADPGTGSFFDSAEGRIVEMYATGFDSPDDLVSFYNSVLPELGWKEVDNLTYVKEGEILEVTPETKGYTTSVKYQLRPLSPEEKARAI